MRPVFAALLLSCAANGAELTGVVGALKPYLDERAGFAVGAALRMPVSRRVAIRPEFLSSSVKYYSHWLGLGCVTVDFTQPERQAVGYAVGCGGAARVTENPIDYRYIHSALMGGVGVRFGGTSRWVGGAEFRVGNIAFPLLTFYTGFRFGR